MTAPRPGHGDDGGIEAFVRDALGCTCPPEVFRAVRVDPEPAAFAGFPGAQLLAIGGRLLVLLVDAGLQELTRAGIEALLLRGRELRDEGGFNRFRLVLVAPPGSETTPALAVDPEAVAPGDGRLHLHRVAPSQLPAGLRRQAVEA